MAFEKFMDHYSSSLFNYVISLIGPREIVEEIVSDVFMEVWKQRATLLEIEHMSGWLHTIAYRKTVSALRQKYSLPQSVNIDDIQNFQLREFETTDEQISRQEEIDRLYKAIDELPPKCKHVFFLAKIDKLPYKEISRTLDISIATINYHISYAMNFLKKKLPGNR